jgi:hypothetical protein
METPPEIIKSSETRYRKVFGPLWKVTSGSGKPRHSFKFGKWILLTRPWPKDHSLTIYAR